MDVAWVIPDAVPGSGGMRTIIQSINALILKGHRCDVYVVPDSSDCLPSEQVEECLRDSYGLLSTQIYFDLDYHDIYDLVIATSAPTVDFALLSNSKNKAYFVQDYEPWFYPMGDDWLRASNTYRRDLKIVTIGRYLSGRLKAEYNIEAEYFDFCADLTVYRPLAVEKERAICVMLQPEKPRRCSRLVLTALHIVAIIDPTIKVYFYGSDVPFDYATALNAEDLGLISVAECNDLYNRCLLGVCCSSSNPSRIPFEMQASGLPVVDLYLENNLFDFTDSGVLLAWPTADGLATAILKLVGDKQRRASMSKHGIEFMSHRPIACEAVETVRILESFVSDAFRGSSKVAKQYLEDAVMPDRDTQYIAQVIERNRFATIAESRKSLSSPYVKVRVASCDYLNAFKGLRIAVWVKPDQGDLLWHDMERSADTDGFEAVFSLDQHDGLCGNYNIHIYGIAEDGSSVMLKAIIRRLGDRNAKLLPKTANDIVGSAKLPSFEVFLEPCAKQYVDTLIEEEANVRDGKWCLYFKKKLASLISK